MTANLTLALQPDKPRYRAGELPNFRALLSNEGPRPVRFCAYMLGARILSTLNAVDAEELEYELYPFKPGRWARFKAEDIRALAPGKPLAIKLPVAESSVWGFVRTGSQPPVIPASHIIKGFAAGEVTFRARLDPKAALYVGAENFYDRRWEWKEVPGGLPGAEGQSLPPVYDQPLKAKLAVRFG